MDENKEKAGETPKGETLDDIEKEVKAKPKKPGKKKRRAGRPTLEEQAAKEAEVAAELAIDISAIKGMMEWIFGSILAPRFGPHWRLRADEAEAGAQAWGAVLNKYSPTAGRFIEEIRAGMWTMGTVGPRWEKTKQLMMEQAAKQAAQEKAEPEAAGQPA